MTKKPLNLENLEAAIVQAGRIAEERGEKIRREPVTDLEKIEEAILRLHRGMQRAFERSLLPGEVSTHVAGPTGFMVIGGQQVPYEIRDGKVVWLTDTGSAPQD